jgi:basic amino acid/polyamine antiporter, APA family
MDPIGNSEGQLCRSFRKRDGIALVVSSVVGGGISTTPSVVANLVPHPSAILALWLTGGVLALVGASCYARLANLCPTAGGEYLYLFEESWPARGISVGLDFPDCRVFRGTAASSVAMVMFASRYFPRLVSEIPLVGVALIAAGIPVTAGAAEAAK